jgi:hypothetical protein
MSQQDQQLDKTTEIQQGNAEVGPFVKGVIAIITVVCVVYLVLHFNP